ncbi:MAG: DNA translocase FtsK [Bacillota bacterium]
MARGKDGPGSQMGTDIAGILLLALGALGYFSLYGASGGAVGELLTLSLRLLTGEAAMLFPGLAVLAGMLVLFNRKGPALSARLIGLGLGLFLYLTVLHLQFPEGLEFANALRRLGGGVVGAAGAWTLVKAFGVTGRYVFIGAWGLVTLVLITGVSPIAALPWLKLAAAWALNQMIAGLREAPRLEELETAAAREPILAPAPQEPVRRETRPRDAQRPPVQLTMDGPGEYQLPPLTLLARGGKVKSLQAQKEIAERSRLLEETLRSFGISARVVDVARGSTVTRYELQPGPGVKVSRITSLADDLALNLAAPDVRIEAPIPGKAAIGIEIPNAEVTPVYLREALESQEFLESTSPLTVGLGKDIAGKTIVVTLDRMLHLLIAGATGSGKSVCINSLVASILYKARPEEVKFLMIDPKVVELSNFNGIPHLIAPVVTEPKRAAACLKWVVMEMHRRYELFNQAGVREIGKYNQGRAHGRGDGAALPYIVVIIDELADLMMVSAVEVEDAICRLAQMARASGIHLVVATQRPSVDVVTGLIKANIPSRIAFAVSSQVDSRTVFDINGAERLLGRGDMLVWPVGAPKPVRAQGAYVSETEIEELAQFVRGQARPEYEQGVLSVQDGIRGEVAESEEDERFLDALRVVVETRQASVSMLQRRLRIGYSRAARLVDVMEERGYVGPHEGTKAREVLISLDQYRRLMRGEGKE